MYNNQAFTQLVASLHSLLPQEATELKKYSLKRIEIGVACGNLILLFTWGLVGRGRDPKTSVLTLQRIQQWCCYMFPNKNFVQNDS